ncbi:hypothetical protein LTR56_025910 [Elasticomyces elasticus]|nr:hypothetical protein LTR22_027956 [Elasticomyces elasticus]KAK3616504.1 hypothetical protein LTR56_025910 [Elasticomyces elasticus]KAK4904038.1 hypothetical protein LTR49_026448 [Elasticomyces elasticus]
MQDDFQHYLHVSTKHTLQATREKAGKTLCMIKREQVLVAARRSEDEMDVLEESAATVVPSPVLVRVRRIIGRTPAADYKRPAPIHTRSAQSVGPAEDPTRFRTTTGLVKHSPSVPKLSSPDLTT